MKYIAFILFFGTLLMAEPDWAESYKAGLEQAKKEQKMVMVMLSSANCDACWYMENVVFEEDDVVYELQMDFVPVHIDIHDDVIPDGLGYIGTPTFHFLDAEGKKIDRLDGAANVQDFTTLIRDIKKAVRN